ncbi:MAG: GIY-YIG nuclease family protein [Nitrospirae bacterium]|nr:GIY-YIG nuclease family protein [Fimbriimonadaceae bacterium]
MDREFNDTGAISFDRDAGGRIREFAPQARYAGATESRLHRYGKGTFCRFKLLGLPSSSGVYMFLVDNCVVYVGRAIDVRKRFTMGYGNISPKNCYEGGQQTNCRINQLVLGSASAGSDIRILVHLCDDQAELEQRLIAHLKPAWNRTT